MKLELNLLGIAFVFFGSIGITTVSAIDRSEVSQVVENTDLIKSMIDNDFDPSEVRVVLAKTKTAFAEQNMEMLASISIFPLRINTRGRNVIVKSQADMERLRSVIFSSKVRKAVAAGTFEMLFVRSDGIMIGDGEVWFRNKCLDGIHVCSKRKLLIQAINSM